MAAFFQMLVNFIYAMLGYRKVTAISVLSTASGTKIQGGSVTLSYQKGGSWSTDGTAVTDSTGTASSAVFLKKGNYTFRVNFAGSPGLSPSSAQMSAKV